MSSMDKKYSSSPQLKSKVKQIPGAASDSEGSNESSPSGDSLNDAVPKTPPKEPGHGFAGKRTARRESEWEILEGLREGQRFERRPEQLAGHLHKKRKWPLKGWHKRYFVLNAGVLAYGKSPGDVTRGKLHGSLDIGLSVISAKPARRRIDIDAEEFIYHLKAKASDEFSRWVDLLTQHRRYRQHQLCFGTARNLAPGNHGDRDDDSAPNEPAECAVDVSPVPKELTQAAQNLSELGKILARLRQAAPDPSLDAGSVSPGGAGWRKERRKFGLRKRKAKPADGAGGSPSKGAEVEAVNSLAGVSMVLSASNSSLAFPAAGLDELGPGDLRLGAALQSETQLREDFLVLATEVLSSLESCVRRVRAEDPRGTSSLRAALRASSTQNAELRARLAQVHAASDLDAVSAAQEQNGSGSFSSSCLSASEFFDAEDATQRDTSSEVNSLSSEGNNSSEGSDNEGDFTAIAPTTITAAVGVCSSGRRARLPVPRPDTEGLSLWNLLCKNIGQDLSQVSMSVALNEPLNMMQRLCEELEYSELLDAAAASPDATERMTLVAAFAVSGYAASFHRAGSKPFNPLLGETYECVRDDRGFRFVAEQVSHHPPVSACHAESRNFVFWQDVRIKTKFWGKSMEFQPTGTVSVLLPKHSEVYRWNKVTTCVHNLFSGQRWVDQYGELRLTCGNLTCKLSFIKASYWSAKRHEVVGTVVDGSGRVLQHISGKWSEAVYAGKPPQAKCVWRPGPMPPDHELYYGFTQFATELNEIEPESAKLLPRTDSRFRPDQRLLEEGQLAAADTLKAALEQSQRERRKQNELEGTTHAPRWFRKTGGDAWESTGQYWECRKPPGFASQSLDTLW